MKIGVVGRGELTRGLGVQTWEAVQHLRPAKVLLVDVGDEHEAEPSRPRAFGHPTVLALDEQGRLPERATRQWLHGLDVVLGFETLYDWRVCDWARDLGVRTVVQANPEFYRHAVHPQLPHPDGWWNPTTWRLDQLPVGARVVPVPVALERFPVTGTREGPPRFLHAVGKPAIGDRNGTEPFLHACRILDGRVDATLRTLWPLEGTPAGVTVQVGGVDDYWLAYRGFDALVLPRRYGGLCLPAQEAMAAGLALAMTDVAPNPEMWPVEPIQTRNGGRMPLPAGWVETAEVRGQDVADTMLRLCDPGRLAGLRAASSAWAEEHSWDAMLPRYLDELARVIDDPLPTPPPGQRAHDPFAARG